MRQVTHALLTRPPLSHFDLSFEQALQSVQSASFDLHVLSTPPAFILSQDQTLKLKCLILSELLAWLIILWFISEPLNSLLFKERFVLQICSLNILLEFSRLSYCSVIKVLRRPVRVPHRDSLFSLPNFKAFVNYFFIYFFKVI